MSTLIFTGIIAETHGRSAVALGEAETLLDLSLNEERSPLKTPVSVLLEDGTVVSFRISATVQHGREKIVDLRVGVVGVVGVSWGPVTLVQHHASQAVSTGSGEARDTIDKAFVAKGNLQEVLGEGPGFQVIIVGLADASEEAHRTWPA